jgi:hypothetical protein
MERNRAPALVKRPSLDMRASLTMMRAKMRRIV